MSDKRRKQLRRFMDMRDDFLAQEISLAAAIVDAHATVSATKRLLDLAEDEEFLRFQDYAATLEAPGRTGCRAHPLLRRRPARTLPARPAATLLLRRG